MYTAYTIITITVIGKGGAALHLEGEDRFKAGRPAQTFPGLVGRFSVTAALNKMKHSSRLKYLMQV